MAAKLKSRIVRKITNIPFSLISVPQNSPSCIIKQLFLFNSSVHGGNIVASCSDFHQPTSTIAENAFDGKHSTRWGNNNLPNSWVQLHFIDMNIVSQITGGNNVVTKYTIYVDDNDSFWNNLNYAPKDWHFQGSNDGTNWDDLDTQLGVTWSSAETKEFTITNTQTYEYFRLFVSANNDSSNWIMVNELDIFNSDGVSLLSPVPVSLTVTIENVNSISNLTPPLNIPAGDTFEMDTTIALTGGDVLAIHANDVNSVSSLRTYITYLELDS